MRTRSYCTVRITIHHHYGCHLLLVSTGKWSLLSYTCGSQCVDEREGKGGLVENNVKSTALRVPTVPQKLRRQKRRNL